MANMSFVSLVNILLSSVEEHENKATQEDIDKYFGWGERWNTLLCVVVIIRYGKHHDN